MKKISETIIFFGNERLATGVTTNAPTLQALIDTGYNVAAVVANYAPSASRKLRTLEVQEVAKRHNIPVLLPLKTAEIKDRLQELKPMLGVLVAYGKIVPQTIIDVFPNGIVNIHPSLLPRHRGPTPIESAILNGEAETGVSIMQLIKEMDAGPIFAQEKLRLRGDETKHELAAKLLTIGKDLLLKHLPAILDGSFRPMPQDNIQATYDSLLRKDQGFIDWRKPAEQLEREIRAYAGWPRSRTNLGGKEASITEAAVSQKHGKPGSIVVEGKRFFVCCGSGALEIKRLKPAGGPDMASPAFLAGYQQFL